jgi:hypothetical protein
MVQSAAKPRQRTRADGTKLEPSLEIDVMRMARLAALQGRRCDWDRRRRLGF